ncbi:hypothetical protein D3C72_1013500 [compost metagenome]
MAPAPGHSEDRIPHAAHRYARYRLSQGLYSARLRHRPRRSGAGAGPATHRRHQHADLPARARRDRRRPAGHGGRGPGAARRNPRRPAVRQREGRRRHAHADRPAGAGHARHHHRLQPGGKYHAVRPLRLQRQLLHPVRSRRLPPHHLFPRSTRRDGDLPRHAARRPRRQPGAALQRQPAVRARAARWPPRSGLGRPVPQAVLPVRAGGRQAGLRGGAHHQRLGQGKAAAGLGGAAGPRQDPPRHGLPDPCHPLGRAPLRAGTRP